MKRMFTAVVFSGLLALGVTAAASTANASAIAVGATTSDLVKTVGQSSENIVEVNHRRGHRSHRHRGHRHHAHRHHHRHHGRHHRRHRHQWRHHRNRHHWRPGGNFFLQFGVPAAPRIAPAPRRAMPTAHVRWCEKKYRSYRASDNTFQPYNGPRKACVSPYYP